MQLHTVSFITTRDIEAGEELLLNYGSTYNDWSMCPQPWLSDPDAVVDVDLIPVSIKKEPGAEPETKKSKARADWECECGCEDDVVVEEVPAQKVDDKELTQAQRNRNFRMLQHRSLVKHIRKNREATEECQALLDVIKQHPRFASGLHALKGALQLAIYFTLQRKKFHFGSLNPEEELLYHGVRDSYDPDDLIQCTGPCGRRLKRSHFGLIKESYIGLKWPPCDDCK
jgi:hypothetical protein